MLSVCLIAYEKCKPIDMQMAVMLLQFLLVRNKSVFVLKQKNLSKQYVTFFNIWKA